MIMTYCNGCGRAIKKPTLTAERTDGLDGARPLPSGGEPIHWCINCALIATAAVAKLISYRQPAERSYAAYIAAYQVNEWAAEKVPYAAPDELAGVDNIEDLRAEVEHLEGELKRAHLLLALGGADRD